MTLRPPPRIRHAARAWPVAAVALVLAHGVLHAWLQSSPGAPAIPVFVVVPSLLFGLTILTIAAAGRDLLHGGWRRVLTGTAFFPAGALVASLMLSTLTYRVYPSSHDAHPPDWCLALPLTGDIAVLHGGRTVDTNGHAGRPAQRYAYDLALARDGVTHRGEGSDVRDHYAYEQLVLAPMGGTVVAVKDGEADQSPGHGGWGLWRRADGNHIVMQVDAERYLVLAHLQAGSIPVRPGDVVTAGAPIGRVGNSGRSRAPHLHLHVQDHPEPNRGEAVPVSFCRHEVASWGTAWSDATIVNRGMPTGRDRPQMIRAAPSPR